MIGPIEPRHHAKILQLNRQFVHWLSPLSAGELNTLLARAAYKRQINDGAGVLIGYGHDVDDPDHKNLNWLRAVLPSFFYIDRIIIDGAAQGQGLGLRLYDDMSDFARAHGYEWLACEVNTQPDNPSSHRFHLRHGFAALGDADYPAHDLSVRYYAKPL